MEHFFSSNSSGHLRSDAHQSQIIEGGCRCKPYSNYWGWGYSQIIGWDADVDHSQTIGGNTVKLLGGYIPHSPRVSAPRVTSVTSPQK